MKAAAVEVGWEADVCAAGDPNPPQQPTPALRPTDARHRSVSLRSPLLQQRPERWFGGWFGPQTTCRCPQWEIERRDVTPQYRSVSNSELCRSQGGCQRSTVAGGSWECLAVQ